MAEVAQAVEVVDAPVGAPTIENDEQAVKLLVENARQRFELIRGLNQVVRAIDTKQAVAVVLASDCDESSYKNLVTSLCAARGVRLFTTFDRKTLGELSGLCRYDDEMNARKVARCSSVAIRQFDHSNPFVAAALSFLNIE